MMFRYKGEIEKARMCLQEALTIQEKHFGAQAFTLNHLGILELKCGNIDRAIELQKRGVALCRQTGEQKFLGLILGCMGQALYQNGEHEEAKEIFQQCITICDRVTPHIALHYRGVLSCLLAKEGSFTQALMLLKKDDSALLQQPQEHIEYLCNKGEVFWLAQQKEEAHNILERIYTIKKDLILTPHTKERIGEFLRTLGKSSD